MFFPLPTLLISPRAISFRKAPSIELMLKDGQSSLISCFVNLFFTPDEEFDEYCRENNIPIVRDVKGKLLTGKVVYSEHFKQYGENEDDIIYMLDVAAEKEGLTPEEYREQNRGQNILDGVEVDLDKKFGWRE